MKIQNTTLLALLVAGLPACGGGTGDTGSQPAPLQFDASAAMQSGVDLSLQDVNFVNGAKSEAGKTVALEARVVNNGSNPFDMASVSLALEYSTTQSFERVYRSVVFDVRPTATSDNSVAFSARAATASLPAGSYYTRLAVNPDWRLYFDNLPVDSDYSRTSRYLAEYDYGNNTSQVVQFDVTSPVSCTEDGFEPNNDFVNAIKLQPDGVINGALCEDDIDLYSMQLNSGEQLAATLTYQSSNQLGKTRYVVIDPQYKRVGESAVAQSGKAIIISAKVSGQYYLALYGDRSGYSLSVTDNASLFSDPELPFFTSQSVQGPYSPVYGQITLKKLSFDKPRLTGEIATCGIQTASYQNEQPVWYATPQHFSGNHIFQFGDNGSYLVDGSLHSGWTIIDGDISNGHWYANLFPGWAEDIGDGGWRYWARDGLSYVECRLN